MKNDFYKDAFYIINGQDENSLGIQTLRLDIMDDKKSPSFEQVKDWAIKKFKEYTNCVFIHVDFYKNGKCLQSEAIYIKGENEE